MIAPGATLGIIGGGQLGRMMALAAARLGYTAHIFTPEKHSPASQVALATTVAAYDDEGALMRFADSVAAVTFEFENIPHESLLLLESRKPVRPGARLLATCRNRIREKQFVNSLGIKTAPFMAVTSQKELEAAVKKLGLPAILKTTELGYDGKGQLLLRETGELAGAFAKLNTPEAVLEGFVEFSMEVSVIVARSVTGEVKCYDAVQNIHLHHILDTTIAPAPISQKLAREAQHIATEIAKSSELVGLLAVEMFVTKSGIVVNELAPRPHNSGHWSIDACVTSQFEQAVRASLGLSLGDTSRLCDAEMKNLIGDEVRDWERYLHDPRAKLHLYGKADIRAGRKMGHVTFLKP